MSKNKKWSSAAKFDIAIQAVKGDKTINEICTKYGVSPSQVHLWKKQLLEDGKQLFDRGAKKKKNKQAIENQTRIFHEKVGQLTMERDFLKKSWDKYHGNDDEN